MVALLHLNHLCELFGYWKSDICHDTFVLYYFCVYRFLVMCTVTYCRYRLLRTLVL